MYSTEKNINHKKKNKNLIKWKKKEKKKKKKKKKNYKGYFRNRIKRKKKNGNEYIFKDINIYFFQEMDNKSRKEYDDKEFAPCDLKLIILGDSAVGKSKYHI